jgi:hypothetical protein
MESSALGYVFDFIAGFLIIQSIILRSTRHIKVETSSLWDGNPLLYETQLKAFWDGWLGVLVLFVGLILHLIHFALPLCMGLVTVGMTIVLCSIARHLLEKHIAAEVRKEYASYDEIKRRTHS